MPEIQDIYDSLTGVVRPEYAVAWVENIFAPGKPCDLAYRQLLLARDRLLHRLGQPDEDPDLERMLQVFEELQEEVGREMFRCGVEYARRNAL